VSGRVISAVDIGVSFDAPELDATAEYVPSTWR
jgi:hypothetical protein